MSTTELPTTLVQDGSIIYYTGSSAAAEGLYRWNGSAYAPGPRVLDIRDTVGTTVATQAEDVDTITFSNEFIVSENAEISLASPSGGTGFYAEDIGMLRLNDFNYQWTTDAAKLISGSGWTYAAGTGSTTATLPANRGPAGGNFTNATGSDFTLARVDIDLDVYERPTDGDSNPFFNVDYQGSNGTWINFDGNSTTSLNACLLYTSPSPRDS